MAKCKQKGFSSTLSLSLGGRGIFVGIIGILRSTLYLTSFSKRIEQCLHPILSRLSSAF